MAQSDKHVLIVIGVAETCAKLGEGLYKRVGTLSPNRRLPALPYWYTLEGGILLNQFVVDV